MGQTSIRKLTSNLGKFRFERHVLIRYSVFKRNLEATDVLCQQFSDIEVRCALHLDSATNKRHFWSLSVCLASAIDFDSLSTHRNSIQKLNICAPASSKFVVFADSRPFVKGTYRVHNIASRNDTSSSKTATENAKTFKEQLRQRQAALFVYLPDSYGNPELSAKDALSERDLPVHHGPFSLLQRQHATVAKLIKTQSEFQWLLSKDPQTTRSTRKGKPMGPASRLRCNVREWKLSASKETIQIRQGKNH